MGDSDILSPNFLLMKEWRKGRDTDSHVMSVKWVKKPQYVDFKNLWDTITYSNGILSIQFRILVKQEIDEELIKRNVRHYITTNYSRKNIIILEEVNNKENCKCYRISLTMKTSLPTRVEIEKIIDDLCKIMLNEEINIDSTTNNFFSWMLHPKTYTTASTN